MRQITTSREKTSEGIPIGELSRLTDVNIETIRFYEKIKMLPVPLRTEGGHRVYGPKETRALAFIRNATRAAPHRGRSSRLWAKRDSRTGLHPTRERAGFHP